MGEELSTIHPSCTGLTSVPSPIYNDLRVCFCSAKQKLTNLLMPDTPKSLVKYIIKASFINGVIGGFLEQELD